MTRPMVTFGIAFLAAMLAVSFLPAKAVLPLVFLLLCGLIPAGLLRPGVPRATLCTVSAAALAGCLCFGTWLIRTGFDFQALAGSTHRLSGTVEEIRATSGGTRLALTLHVTGHDIPGAPLSFRAIAYVPGETEVDFCDAVTVTGKCLGMSATPDFRMADYYRGEGVSLTLSTYSQAEVARPVDKPLSYYPRDWNRQLCAAADRVYRQPYSGLVRAVLLGDKSQIDSVIYNRFARTGITHMFVVSGMHVSLMAGAVFLLCRRLAPRPRALLGCAAAWIFVALTGFGLPALRAGIMSTLLLAGTMFRRPADALNSLFLAGVLIAGGSPAAILSGSFRLSMTSTLGVVLFAGPIAARLEAAFHLRGRPSRAASGLAACSLGANLGMFPFLWQLFGGISLVFPLSNLLALPLLPVILVSSALSLAVGDPLAAFFASVTRGALRVVLESARLLSSLHGLYLGLDYGIVGAWLPLGLLVVLIAVVLRRRKLAVRAAAGFFALLFCLIGLRRGMNQDTVELTPVYSFEGLSVAIQQGGRATLVGLLDDGQVDRTAEAFLRGRNVQTVDSLILSYGGPARLSDSAFLSETLGLGRVFAPADQDYYPYLTEALHPAGGVYPLREGHGYDLRELPGGGLLEVYREHGEILVSLTMGGTRVAITGSAELAAESSCEILLYSGKNLEKIKQIPLKYVILLSEPDSAGPLPDGVCPAWSEPLTLCLRADGSFRLDG